MTVDNMMAMVVHLDIARILAVVDANGILHNSIIYYYLNEEPVLIKLVLTRTRASSLVTLGLVPIHLLPS
jgi:hypothetical protein